MKRIPFVLAAALIIAAFARPALALDARVGVKGGVSLFNFHTSTPALSPVPFTTFVWPMAGVFIKISWGAFSIEPEANYMRAGAKFSAAGAEFQYRIDYVQVPLLLKVALPPRGRIQPEIFAGPYAATRLSARLQASSGGATATTDIKSQVRSWDWGIVGGIGVNVTMGMVVLSFEGRYCHGIQNVNLTLEALDVGQHAMNRGAIFMVGLGF